jgi:enterobactin synthetase component D
MSDPPRGAPARRETHVRLWPAPSPHILPSGIRSVAARFAYEDVPPWEAPDLGIPLPLELEDAVARRRAEYLTGRWCARAAVRSLLPEFQGQIGSRSRAPAWPPGIVGSITHTGAFACAAVAPARDAAGLGIDSETLGTAETIAAIRELAGAPGEGRPHPEMADDLHYTLLFSAKESVFKCLFPVARRMFWYQDARVALCPANGTFRATLLVDLGPDLPRSRTFDGTYRVAGRVVHTAVVLSRTSFR